MLDDAPQSSDQPDETAMLRGALQAAEARIATLKQIIKGFQRARFGPSSERVDTGQLALELGRAPGLPPEKWSSLKWAFEPEGGCWNVAEEA
ncbi:transposase [Neoroseomonas lacus]|uniref:Transposase TnpC homeodomain domain-containing protein n=1 Tax=Neoroseomonas lacus TaxID=287609 RepID=A0A917NZF8_9PROT|nr:transposase [Neoroseomonas lacus]GGJ44206.1 hypothetical protein GCM10011320_59630 [Neoroseomonas lacus]